SEKTAGTSVPKGLLRRSPPLNSLTFRPLLTPDTRLESRNSSGMGFPVTAEEADDSYQALGAGRSMSWRSHRFQVAFVHSARRKHDARSVKPSATIAWRFVDDKCLGPRGIVGRACADCQPALDLAPHLDGLVGNRGRYDCAIDHR